MKSDESGSKSNQEAKSASSFKIPLPKSFRKEDTVPGDEPLGSERADSASVDSSSQKESEPIADPIPEGGSQSQLEDELFKQKFDHYFSKGFTPYAILGDSQSGKTVLLIRLFEFLIVDYHEDEQTIIAHDEETEQEFLEQINLLEEGKWPSPTEGGFIYAFHYKPQNFMFIDLAGANFEKFSRESASAPLRFEYLNKCKGFLYLIDSSKLNSSSSIWQYHKRFQDFVIFLRAQNHRRVTHPLVVAFSKADVLPDTLDTLYHGQGPFTLAREQFRQLHNLVREVFKYYKFAYISSVGMKPDPFKPGLTVPIAGRSRPPLGFEDVLTFLTQTNRSGISTRTAEYLAGLLRKEY